MPLEANKLKGVVLNHSLPGITDDLFLHQSDLHGSEHVNRVIVHIDILTQLLGWNDAMRKAAWAAAYLHDLARTHDGTCEEHGPKAAKELFPKYEGMFLAHGVRSDQFEAIRSAVHWHSIEYEAPKDHKDIALIRALKDADALDRWRIGDLDEDYLRFSASREMLLFSEQLYLATDGQALNNIDIIREKATQLLNSL